MGKISGKNRDILIALILVGIVIAAAGSYLLYRHFFEKYLTYEDRMYGLKIDHPADWPTAFEHKMIKENRVINIIAFLTPDNKPGDIDNFVNIIAYPVPQGVSLPDHVANEIVDMQTFYRGFQMLDSSDTTLGGLPAHRLVYTFSQGGIEYKKLQIHVLKGQQGYALGYLQDVKNFDWYMRQVEKMAKSFEFTKP
ncbi:MAG: DcrB-related protein [Proteobacteria bacterium]|nr:DcrB-related protein [Pseudomonadota bacterium]